MNMPATQATEPRSPEHLNDDHLFALDMLTKGYTPQRIHEISNIDLEVIRDLANEFRELISKELINHQIIKNQNDATYANLATKSLQRLEGMLAFESDIVKVLRVHEFMDKKVKDLELEARGKQLGTEGVRDLTIVSIQLPQSLSQRGDAIVDSVVLDSKSHVIAIGDKSVASASKDMIGNLERLREEANQLREEDFR